ncbi:hypothetical protein WME79_12515 [Sorangium sp. So ce726]|uniref:hypothetical protein n=1 Tax=Sorangium sp. So ce726 TaxID=3133319 RepID=UPI003F5F71E9
MRRFYLEDDDPLAEGRAHAADAGRSSFGGDVAKLDQVDGHSPSSPTCASTSASALPREGKLPSCLSGRA